MWRIAARAISLVLTVVLTTAAPGRAVPKERLMVTGSSTVAPIVLEIAKRFEAAHPGVQIDVQTGGSSRGIHDARTGLADIGMISRRLKASEGDLRSHTIAIDAVVVIVNAANPLQQLTRAQLIDLYVANVGDWSQMGPFSGQPVVVSKAEGRSTLEVFQAFTKLASSDIEADIIIGDNEQAIKTVAANRQAVAYVSVGAVIYHMENGLPIRAVAIDGVVPNLESLATGNLPMTRELNLVTADQPRGVAAQFIAFAQSPAVGDILDDFYVLSPPR